MAHTYPEWWLKLTGQAAHWSTDYSVAEPTDNLTTKAVLSLDKQAKPYQVGIYARLSYESEANKERDTVDTQIAYIREFVKEQDC